MARKRRQRVTFEGPCIVSGERYPDGGNILIEEGPPHRGRMVLLADEKSDLHTWIYAGRRGGVPHVRRYSLGQLFGKPEPVPAGYRILGEVLVRSFIPSERAVA